MKWFKYQISTTTAASDLIVAMLAEQGIEGAQVEDHVPLSEADCRRMFVDITPDMPADDGLAVVDFYTEEELSDEALQAVRDGLAETALFVDIGEGTIAKSETEDQDWMNSWKEFFHPFTVDDILIKPTWETVSEEEAAGKIVIEIDPGIAFGTGKHETTQLCIRGLRKRVTEGCSVLDVGCGSGILSIIAYTLGAAHVVGTDLDENAVTAAKENMLKNLLPEDAFTLHMGNIIDDEAVQQAAGSEYDVVVANILADVICPLSGMITRHMKKGAYYITSGIIDTKEAEVTRAMQANPELEIVEVTRQGDWVSITARKR
ncbi:MAG: 50S ribosomal protein L11 methyltransferase [Lachnospiraceae bacterium]|nr:50S ribosomal protein L11 methyltransferase [Lachnospiraceae bacterium]